jgi:hypothetical protein
MKDCKMTPIKRSKSKQSKYALLPYAAFILCFICTSLQAQQEEPYKESNAVFWDSDFAIPSNGHFFEDILPDFFHQAPRNEGPSMSISIQHMSGNHPALKDDERLDNFKPFQGDPLDRKEIVVEIPID